MAVGFARARLGGQDRRPTGVRGVGGTSGTGPNPFSLRTLTGPGLFGERAGGKGPVASSVGLRPPKMPTFDDIMRGVPGPDTGGSFGMSSGAGLGQLAAAQQQAAEALAALDRQFEERKALLQEQYALEETPEEKANIQHLLAIIEVQRSAGTKVIERVYGEAIEGAAVRAEETRAEGQEFGARQAETFEESARSTAELMGEMNSRFGGAMGVSGEALSPIAEAAVSDLQRQGQIERAFDERMFNLTADDISVLGEAMRPEMGAQVGALQRTAATTSALSQFEHDRAVQARVAQERMQFAASLQQLAGMFDQRRFGLQDQQIGLSAQAADMQAQNARTQASLRAQGANTLSPQQQFAMQQAEARFAQQQAEYQRQQGLGALRGLGVPGRVAGFADALGLGQDLGTSILFPDPRQQAIRD